MKKNINFYLKKLDRSIGTNWLPTEDLRDMRWQETDMTYQ
jgi:hypothetical protein